MEPINLQNNRVAEDGEWTVLNRYPKGFDARDKKLIKVFAERLRMLREQGIPVTEEERILGKKEHAKSITQKELAQFLNVKPQAVYKYEKGKIAAIPLERMRRICQFFDVTPHYMLGYVDDPGHILDLDKLGNIKKTANGNKQVLTVPMSIMPVGVQTAIEAYRDLYMVNQELFFDIYNCFLSSDPNKLKYMEILKKIRELR